MPGTDNDPLRMTHVDLRSPATQNRLTAQGVPRLQFRLSCWSCIGAIIADNVIARGVMTPRIGSFPMLLPPAGFPALTIQGVIFAWP